MKNIVIIMKMINWHSPKRVQQLGVKCADKIADMRPFIQPQSYGSKAVWDNCAIILSNQSDSKLEPYLDELLEWLQDINWPGAFTIIERLNRYSGDKLTKSLENAVSEAIKMPYEDSMMWLDYLSELLDNKSLLPRLSPDTVSILKEHYHKWGSWYRDLKIIR